MQMLYIQAAPAIRPTTEVDREGVIHARAISSAAEVVRQAGPESPHGSFNHLINIQIQRYQTTLFASCIKYQILFHYVFAKLENEKKNKNFVPSGVAWQRGRCSRLQVISALDCKSTRVHVV